MAGLLCPKLTDTQTRQKQNMEHQLAEKVLKPPSYYSWLNDAWHTSRIRRWGRATVGTVIPPVRWLL